MKCQSDSHKQSGTLFMTHSLQHRPKQVEMHR